MPFGAFPFNGYGRGFRGNVPGMGPFGLGSLGGLGFAFGGLGAIAGIAGAAYAFRAVSRAGLGFGAQAPFFF